MSTIKGILSFPALFTPKTPKGGNEPKYGATVLLPPTDPQVALIQAEVQQAKLNGCPNGYKGKDECFGAYDTMYQGKEYYDPKFSGWFVFKCSAKADDKPSVVDMNRMPIVDPSLAYAGAIVYVSANISYYEKGSGGIGGWLNGVMVTDEAPTMGRLDNKPTVDQMFASISGGATNVPPVPGVTPPAPPAPPAQLVMTAAAAGVTYEQYMATPGWTDEMLIAQGLAIKPSFT